MHMHLFIHIYIFIYPLFERLRGIMNNFVVICVECCSDNSRIWDDHQSGCTYSTRLHRTQLCLVCAAEPTALNRCV